ncbi:MAG: hypothetical protein GF388_02610 [Candidatus Aegiribacteria sp.]|nr:hypothetical protein [Candidatus Aegiribacteria sp.]MBD3294192.1 hypothetical protein [Candidatus Fermentibacteria bacterium]
MKILPVLTFCLMAASYADGTEADAVVFSAYVSSDLMISGQSVQSGTSSELTHAQDGGECTRSFQLTLVDSWDIEDWTLGMDIYEPAGYQYLLGIKKDNITDESYVRIYDMQNDMNVIDDITVNSLNVNPFGVVWNNASDSESSTLMTNNHYDPADSMFITEDFGSTWELVTDPGGYKFRGMDFDGDYYWAAASSPSNSLCRFQLGGPVEYYDLSEFGITDTPNGVAVIPQGDELLIAVGSYYLEYLNFYSFDGSTLTFLDSVDYPDLPSHTLDQSMGLTYTETTGHLYWSYIVVPPNDFWISELAIGETSLQRTTWGDIKSSF